MARDEAAHANVPDHVAPDIPIDAHVDRHAANPLPPRLHRAASPQVSFRPAVHPDLTVGAGQCGLDSQTKSGADKTVEKMYVRADGGPLVFFCFFRDRRAILIRTLYF
jgi:hypothetical protein